MSKRSLQLPSADDEPTTIRKEIRPEVLAEAIHLASLDLVKGPGAPEAYPLSRERLFIGRGRTADVSIDSAELSRRHAVLARVENEWTVEDLDSRNGIYLNGLKVHSATLRDGDKLQLGELVFVFREGR